MQTDQTVDNTVIFIYSNMSWRFAFLLSRNQRIFMEDNYSVVYSYEILGETPLTANINPLVTLDLV